MGLAKPDAKGYHVSLGWKPGNGRLIPHKFRLGHLESEAENRKAKLKELWSKIEGRHQRRKEVGLPTDAVAMWDETTLQIGKALASGQTECVLPPPTGLDEPTALLNWITALTRDFGSVIPLRLAADLTPARQKLREEAAAWDETATTIQDRADVAKAVADYARRKAGDAPQHSETLRKALDAYALDVQERFNGPEGLTDFGKLVGRRVTSIRDQLADKLDALLSQVDTPFLNRWIQVWANRPVTRFGKPASVEWSKGCIKTIRDFIRWLNGSNFQWERPRNYEVLPARIKTTDEEVAATKRVRYKRDELVTLWRYATPLERVFILLALNCGFGNGEIVTLRLDEINFEKGVIKRNRRKTAIPAWWRLWDESIAALRFYLDKVRPSSESPYVFVTAEGRPYRQRTAGRNNAGIIPGFWARLFTRIQKDHPDFIQLSFNKLRKTGSNWIRQKHGGELAKLYLSQGKKEIVDAYAGKPFKLMNRAVRQYRRLLSPMFAAVEVPFPEENRKSNPSLSLAKQEKIKEMRLAGYKYAYIRNTLGVSFDTIRRYSK